MTDPTYPQHEFVVLGHDYDGMDVYGCACRSRPDVDPSTSGSRATARLSCRTGCRSTAIRWDGGRAYDRWRQGPRPPARATRSRRAPRACRTSAS